MFSRCTAEPLLVGFDILQGKVAPHFVHDHRTRGGNAGRRRCRRRPAEPRAEIKCRCDPEIQINAEPAAEGGSQTRQSKLHRQAVAPPVRYDCGLELGWRCRDDTTGLRGRDYAGRQWLGDARA